MTVKGCLFDFSGTIFRVEPTARWLRAALSMAGIEATDEEITRYAARLEEVGALPGGAAPKAVPQALARLWGERDIDAERHRAAYVGIARGAELPWPQLYDVLYERHMAPAAWQPYPDTAEVLGALKERGLAVGVLSNIGWDLRPVLRAYGVDGLVDTEVLSFEENVQKPDPRIFRIACDRLGLAPQDVLMVGDSAQHDGGATAIGCAFLQVDHLPADRRPDGLRPVLDLVG
ncbi:HAD-IA family hydrolase [Streptomyces sp. SL13]|uniref:HAD-IA family hydrolase n=1 Tax=Streptantibioticus silvisoli TaxID=2705255 RepID=A0AA90KAF2_9ACTN|nr:HAD-IA family hydrolase [Streptantibioticus silvisoli]MDI5965372.1 HAD-IA family hydrolase [Streptantibioticus silvisoli]MDI5972042.1 HAD-IA family hydrolase [Streptantibioticus silvisoli]